jgi:hypothetical protein
MPKVFYDEEITKDELNTYKLSDEDLIQLMEKYKEKLQRYTLFLNEEKERTERKILLIHLEQVKRFHMKTNNNI